MSSTALVETVRPLLKFCHSQSLSSPGLLMEPLTSSNFKASSDFLIS